MRYKRRGEAIAAGSRKSDAASVFDRCRGFFPRSVQGKEEGEEGGGGREREEERQSFFPEEATTRMDPRTTEVLGNYAWTAQPLMTVTMRMAIRTKTTTTTA